MKFHVRIKPFVSAGDVFLHGDGKTWEIVPLSVFPSGDNTIVRIGRTTYWFAPDGAYGGPEFCMVDPDPAAHARIGEDLGRCKNNRGRAPSYAYFQPDTRGYHNEIALWPKKPELQGPMSVEPPRPPMIFARCCDCGWMLPTTIEADDPATKVKIACPRCGKKWGSEREPGGPS